MNMNMRSAEPTPTALCPRILRPNREGRLPTWGRRSADSGRRVVRDRRRRDRFSRTGEARKATDCGMLLGIGVYDMHGVSGASVGERKRDGMRRFGLVAGGDSPCGPEFGPVAVHHRTHSDRFSPDRNCAGVVGVSGKNLPSSGLIERRAEEIAGPGRYAGMADGVCVAICEDLKPGVRENDIVAPSDKPLGETGPESLEAISGERRQSSRGGWRPSAMTIATPGSRTRPDS